MNLDKFYTKEQVAKRLIRKTLRLDEFDSVIEPSAGKGSFSNNISNVIAFDIAPENNSIFQQDFLKLTDVGFGKKLFIGNPPFGKRSILAKDFIRKAIELDADTIAFILPMTFSKLSNQKIFPYSWRLVYFEPLSDEETTFETVTGEYFVPCGFYIWTRNPKILPDINLRQSKLETPPEFKFLPRESKDADFTINGNNGKIKNIHEVTNPKAEHYIKILDKENFSEIKEKLEKADYSFFSSVNGQVSWIGQQEIIKGYLGDLR